MLKHLIEFAKNDPVDFAVSACFVAIVPLMMVFAIVGFA